MLRRELTAKQFLGWEFYDLLEPFGEKRADYRAASIRETVHNLAVKEGHRKPLEYFLLAFKEKNAGDDGDNKPTWQQMKATAMMIAMAFNAEGKTE